MGASTFNRMIRPNDSWTRRVSTDTYSFQVYKNTFFEHNFTKSVNVFKSCFSCALIICSKKSKVHRFRTQLTMHVKIQFAVCLLYTHMVWRSLPLRLTFPFGCGDEQILDLSAWLKYSSFAYNIVSCVPWWAWRLNSKLKFKSRILIHSFYAFSIILLVQVMVYNFWHGITKASFTLSRQWHQYIKHWRD